jgi:mRNA interferase RelE/StbE
VGYTDFFRVDVGEYRIIYKIHEAENMVLMPIIGKRNDGEVYKKFKRMDA